MEMNLVFRNLGDFLFQKKYVTERNTEQRRCFFLDAASYNNLGDQAISLAMEWFLRDILGKENVTVINECDVLKYIRSLKKQIRPGDVIVLSGGGNMGDLYPRYEALRRKIIRTFPDKRIIIFPQTMDYSNDGYGRNERKRAMCIYGRHPRILVCAREERSFGQMQKLFRKVILVPDIVFYLSGRIPCGDVQPRYDCGICIRDDRESALDEETKERLLQMCSGGGKTRLLTTMAAEGSICLDFDQRYREVSEKIREFAQCRCIITDRLHGMIFSVIAGVPCIAIDNRNHKVADVYHMCVELCRNVRLIAEWGPDGMTDLEQAVRGTEKPESCLTDTEALYRKLARRIKG